MGLLSAGLPFRLCKAKPYTVYRRNIGSVVKGVYVKPDPVEITLDLFIYPHVKRDIIDILPEGLRKRKTISIISNDELKEAYKGSSYLPDEVIYNNQSYRVFKLASFNDVNGVTAYRAYAVMIDNDEIQLII